MSILKMVVEEAVGIFHVSTSDPHHLVLHLALFMNVFASESKFIHIHVKIDKYNKYMSIIQLALYMSII